MVKHLKSKSAILMGVFAASMAPAMVYAADFTGTAEHVTKQIDAAKQFALAIAFMIGLFLFIMGLYGLYKDSKQPGQDHAKKGLISLAIGTMLLIVPTVISIAAGTFDGGGDDKASTTYKSSDGF